MTAKDAESLVLRLESAGVTFTSRAYYLESGGAIPPQVELQHLDPSEWDVDYPATFPVLADTDPNARFVKGFAQLFKADPDFRGLIQDAAGELMMARQLKQFEDSERQCDEATAAMDKLQLTKEQQHGA